MRFVPVRDKLGREAPSPDWGSDLLELLCLEPTVTRSSLLCRAKTVWQSLGKRSTGIATRDEGDPLDGGGHRGDTASGARAARRPGARSTCAGVITWPDGAWRCSQGHGSCVRAERHQASTNTSSETLKQQEGPASCNVSLARPLLRKLHVARAVKRSCLREQVLKDEFGAARRYINN